MRERQPTPQETAEKDARIMFKFFVPIRTIPQAEHLVRIANDSRTTHPNPHFLPAMAKVAGEKLAEMKQQQEIKKAA